MSNCDLGRTNPASIHTDLADRLSEERWNKSMLTMRCRLLDPHPATPRSPQSKHGTSERHRENQDESSSKTANLLNRLGEKQGDQSQLDHLPTNRRSPKSKSQTTKSSRESKVSYLSRRWTSTSNLPQESRSNSRHWTKLGAVMTMRTFIYVNP